MFHKHRLEALSDGIFAIAMTLLVLDLKVPDELPPHFALHLTQEWIGVVITFAIASIYWTLQHKVFELVTDVHERAIVPTFVFLGLISVLPFSTGFFSHHINWRSGYIVYFTHSGLIGAALLAKLQVLVHYGHTGNNLAVETLRMRLLTMCGVMGFLAAGACFVPLNMMSLPTIVAAVFVQVYTRRQKAALKLKYAEPSPELAAG